MQFIKAKTILTKVKDGDSWYGVDYNMNLYRGCSHGCIYCDSRSSCYHINQFDEVRGKENALFLLEKELIKNKKGVVGIGAMSDTYNPQEKKQEITRKALALISKYGYGVSIDTKSDLILRDLDLLKEINHKNNVIVKFTITTPKNHLSKIIEPRVCSSSKRLEAIKKLSDNGIYVGIMLNPVLPFLNDKEEDIRNLVFLAHQAGAKFITSYMGMTLRDNQRDYYYEKLDIHFKGLKEKYQQIYIDSYYCSVLNAKGLWHVLKEECEKHNILYDMKDIIREYKKEIPSNRQMSFFDL